MCEERIPLNFGGISPGEAFLRGLQLTKATGTANSVERNDDGECVITVSCDGFISSYSGTFQKNCLAQTLRRMGYEVPETHHCLANKGKQ